MASKVNTKFVVILVGSLLTLAIGVGALAAYSLRMSGQRNIDTGTQLIAKAEEARANGDEAAAIEFINDAAGQFGRAVNKDRSRRDWLVMWKDTLLQTVPETAVEYEKQYTQRYMGALDRLASLDQSEPGPQLAFVQVQEKLLRTNGSPNAMLQLENEIEARVQFLPADSPTAIRLQALRGLARTERAQLEKVDAEARTQAKEWMERFYEAYLEDPGTFFAVVGDADAEEFAKEARADHARVAIGLVRSDINEHRMAQIEGRSQEAKAHLATALSTIDRIMAENEEYSSSPEFVGLRINIGLVVASVEIANPVQQRAAQQKVLADAHDQLFSSLAATAADALPLPEMNRYAAWYRSAEDHEVLLREAERAIAVHKTDPLSLFVAGQLLARMDEQERAIEVYEQIRSMPTPPLSLGGMLLPNRKIAATSEQVQLYLDLRSKALREGDSQLAQSYLDKAVATRDALAEISGVATQRFLLLANADIAIARGESTLAISLLEQFRSEFGDDPEVLADLANQLLRQGTVGEARQLLERLVRSGGMNSTGVIVLADIYRSSGDLDLALQLLQSESRRSSNPEVYIDAIERVQQLIDIRAGGAGNDPVFASVMRANELLSRRDFEGAKQVVDRLIQQRPDAETDPRVVMLGAQIDMLAGNKEAAVSKLEAALARDPGNSGIQRLLDRITSDSPTEVELAEIDASGASDLDKALRKYELLRSVGRVDDAMAEIDRAEQIDRDHPTVLDVRFSVALDQNDLAAASRIAQRAEQANVDGVGGLLYQGRLQLARNEDAAAIRSLRTASDLIPSSAQIRRYLGLALLRSGQIDEGLDSLRRAHEARPDNLVILSDYVQALRSLARFSEARAVLDPGVDPNAPARNSRAITNVWLSLESQVGDAERALGERRTYYRADSMTDAFERSTEARENALLLIELLINGDQIQEAEQVLEAVRENLTERQTSQAEAGIAVGRAELIQDPERSREAVDQAVADLRARSEAEADRTQSPDALLEAARFAFTTGRFDEGVEMLRAALPYQAADDSRVSLEIAARTAQRAARLEEEAKQLAAQAQTLEAVNPLEAESLRERAAQTEGRADVSREEATRVYSQLLSAGVPDEDSRIALSLAELLIQSGQLERAEQIVARVRESSPKNLNAILVAARLAVQRGNSVEATRLYNLGVENHPTNYLAFYQRALHSSGDTARRADVLADLRRVNTLRPSLAEGWLLRFQVLMQSGDKNAAFTVLQDGISASPAIAETLTQHLVQELVRDGRLSAAYDAAASRADERTNSVYWQYTAGSLAKQRGAMGVAVRFFERMTEIPDVVANAEQHGLATTLLLDAKLRAGQSVPIAQINRMAGIIEALGFEDGPGVSRLMLLARAYVTVPSERNRANNLVQQAYMVASAPNGPSTPTQKLQLWFQDLPLVVGGATQAYEYVAALNEAIRTQRQQDPASEIPHPLFIRVLGLQAAQSRGESASVLIERCMTLLQEAESVSDSVAVFEIHKRLSNLYYGSGDFDTAVVHGRQALAINPNDLELLNNVAFFLAQYLDKPSEAVPFAERAMQIGPDNADVLDTVGTVYMLNGEFSKAITHFERSLRFASTQEQRLPASVHIVAAMLEQGELANAERYLKDAERLLPVVSESSRAAYQDEVSRLRQELDSR